MGKKFKILISCDKANHVCDKTQYNEASIWEKIKLNIHLTYCRACRKYTKNNTKLTKLIKKSDVIFLDKTNKEVLQQNFEEELKNHSF